MVINGGDSKVNWVWARLKEGMTYQALRKCAAIISQNLGLTRQKKWYNIRHLSGTRFVWHRARQIDAQKIK